MKTSIAELKLRARRTLLGNHGTAVGSMLVQLGVMIGFLILMYVSVFVAVIAAIGMADGVAANIFLVGIIVAFYIIAFLMIYMMTPGYYRLNLNLCKEGRAKVTDIFFAFRNRPGKFLGITFLYVALIVVISVPSFLLTMAAERSGVYDFFMLYSSGYSVLLGVLSIYVAVVYGQFYVILAEDPQKGLIEALKESRILMKGNKWRFFRMALSFLGWIFVGYLTMGIGFLWIIPYMNNTYTQFYLDIKPQTEEIPPQWQTDPALVTEPEAWSKAEVWQENEES